MNAERNGPITCWVSVKTEIGCETVTHFGAKARSAVVNGAEGA
ncbi:hypothetical protein [Streptomyces coeruleoprunus]